MIPPVLVVGAYGLVRVRTEQREALAEHERGMKLTVQAVRIAVEHALAAEPQADLRGLLSDLVSQQEQVDRIRVFGPTLTPIVASSALDVPAVTPDDLLRRVVDTGQSRIVRGQSQGRAVLCALVPLRDPEGRVVGVMEVVQFESGTARLDGATRDIWIRLAILLVSGGTLTGLLLRRQVLEPLFRLTDGIRRLGRGEPSPPLPVERHDEIGQVAEAFNAMTARLEETRQRLQVETERVLDLEQQLRRAETLAVAGRLASSLAHEVGTPLNIISGRAEFLMHTLTASDRRRKELEVIVAQIDRITGIIRSLLDMVRSQTFEPQPVAPRRAIDHLLPLLRHAARRRGVALDVEIPADLPTVRADPNQLQQVLINLIMNALEASAAGGRVRVLARDETRDGRAGVQVAVMDDGAGIPPEISARIFEPFFTTKPRGQGTGLGLSICRDIVLEHRGDIRVDSQEGRGTTVTVWLPQPGDTA